MYRGSAPQDYLPISGTIRLPSSMVGVVDLGSTSGSGMFVSIAGSILGRMVGIDGSAVGAVVGVVVGAEVVEVVGLVVGSVFLSLFLRQADREMTS